MKKGQTGIEFVMIISGVFLFFVLFIVLIHVTTEKKNYEKKDIALMVEAQYLADEIALAHEAGPGYQRSFTMPQTVLGRNYKIEVIEKSSIYAYTTNGAGISDNRHALSINSLQVTYKPFETEDRYIIDKEGPNTIKNINGVVNISNSIN